MVVHVVLTDGAEITAQPPLLVQFTPTTQAEVRGAVKIGMLTTITGSPAELYRLAEHVREAARLAGVMHEQQQAVTA